MTGSTRPSQASLTAGGSTRPSRALLTARALAGVWLMTALTACAPHIAYINRDVKRVLVLPPFNDSNDIEASGKLWPHVQQQVAARGYNLVPPSEVTAFYEKCRWHQAEEIQQVQGGVQGIAKEFNADIVVYTYIRYWGKKVLVLSNWVGVQLEAEMLDGKDGSQIWAGKGEHGKSTGGVNVRDAVAGAADALLTSPSHYGPGAAKNCFGSILHAGFDKEHGPNADNVKPDKVKPDKR